MTARRQQLLVSGNLNILIEKIVVDREQNGHA